MPSQTCQCTGRATDRDVGGAVAQAPPHSRALRGSREVASPPCNAGAGGGVWRTKSTGGCRGVPVDGAEAPGGGGVIRVFRAVPRPDPRGGGRRGPDGGGVQGCIGRGRGPPPPPGRPAYAQPLSPLRQVPASMAFVTDSNRPNRFGNLLQPSVGPPLRRLPL